MKTNYIFLVLASGMIGIGDVCEGLTFIAVYCLQQGYVQTLLRTAASTSDLYGDRKCRKMSGTFSAMWALPKHPCFGSSQLRLHLFIYLFDLALLLTFVTPFCPKIIFTDKNGK
jgi:hypothetical protein